MIRLEAKKISIDDATKEPVLILEDEKSKKSLDVLINTLELPWFISFFYNIPQENNTIFHFINSLKKTSFLKLKKIILVKERGHFNAELHYAFFFFKKKQFLNVSDALLLSVSTHTPIYIHENNFQKKERTIHPDPKSLFLENWEPEKFNAPIN